MSEICAVIAYPITVSNHPKVKDGKFVCKYCGIEVFPVVRYKEFVWMHKPDI